MNNQFQITCNFKVDVFLSWEVLACLEWESMFSLRLEIMWHFPLWNMLQDPSSSLLLVQLLLWLHSLAVVGLSRKAGVFLEQWVEIVKLSLNFLIVTGIHGSILWTMVGHHVEGIILQFWIMRNNFFFPA